MSDSGLDIGRRVKARRIADALRSIGGTADDARKLTESDWINAVKLSAQQTGRGYPKRGETWHVSEPTRALVIEMLDEQRFPRLPPTAKRYLCEGLVPDGGYPPPRDEDVPE